jgi:hypothetical protein
VAKGIRNLFLADVAAIANTLGLLQRKHFDEQHPFLAVKQWLQQHDQWLLLLDNLEDFSRIERLVPNARCRPTCFG